MGWFDGFANLNLGLSFESETSTDQSNSGSSEDNAFDFNESDSFWSANNDGFASLADDMGQLATLESFDFQSQTKNFSIAPYSEQNAFKPSGPTAALIGQDDWRFPSTALGGITGADFPFSPIPVGTIEINALDKSLALLPLVQKHNGTAWSESDNLSEINAILKDAKAEEIPHIANTLKSFARPLEATDTSGTPQTITAWGDLFDATGKDRQPLIQLISDYGPQYLPKPDVQNNTVLTGLGGMVDDAVDAFDMFRKEYEELKHQPLKYLDGLGQAMGDIVTKSLDVGGEVLNGYSPLFALTNPVSSQKDRQKVSHDIKKLAEEVIEPALTTFELGLGGELAASTTALLGGGLAGRAISKATPSSNKGHLDAKASVEETAPTPEVEVEVEVEVNPSPSPSQAIKRVAKYHQLKDMIPHPREQYGARFGTPVKYLNEIERKEYVVTLKDGKIYDSKGELFESRLVKPSIFVMDAYGDIYVSKNPIVGKFHHSSFLEGGSVASAGQLIIKKGIIKELDNKSGHYHPGLAEIYRILDEFDDSNVSYPEPKLYSFR